jgi:DNA-binding GntR family transcriptional regulator
MARPPDPRTKAEFVLAQLRDAVTSGELRPGDWIRADQWAEKLGLSETPVREAISRLQGLGLVDIFPHRGARVKARTREHVMETYIIRRALEVAAARAAIEHASDDEHARLVAKIEGLTERMAKAVAQGNVPLVRGINRDIHMSIYEASSLPRLVALIKGLWAVYPFDTLEAATGRPKASLKEHALITEALKERNAARLAGAVERHLAAAQSLLAGMSLPEEMGSPDSP